MRKTTFLITLMGALLLPALASAQSVYSDTYVIPVVAHTPGINGTSWVSDVAVTNFSSTPLNVQFIVIESGESNFDNIFPLTTPALNGSATIAGNTTVLYKDILNGHRGQSGNTSGALIVGGDKPFAVTSRTYDSSHGSVGQTITPARDFFENSTGRSDNTAVVYIPGIVNNATARTNIGFVAGTGSAAGATLGVEVTIRNASGTSVGTKIISVGAGNFLHTQFAVGSITTANFDSGSAEIRLVQGLGTIVPYASVVDNNTGAAAYIMGQFPASTALGKGAFTSNLFRDLLSSWGSK
jgi:hypothetical protein